MFGLDFPEVIIIFGLALIVLGPKKLPGAAAQIGRWVGRARAMARQFREQLEQEVHNVESSLDTRQPPAGARPATPPEPDPPAPAFTPGQPLPDTSVGSGFEPPAAPGEAGASSPLWTDPGLDDAPATPATTAPAAAPPVTAPPAAASPVTAPPAAPSPGVAEPGPAPHPTRPGHEPAESGGIAPEQARDADAGGHR